MDWPEYEYIDDTPTEGGFYTFLYYLGQEVEYLMGMNADPIPYAFSVAIDILPTGHRRYIEDLTTERNTP